MKLTGQGMAAATAMKNASQKQALPKWPPVWRREAQTPTTGTGRASHHHGVGNKKTARGSVMAANDGARRKALSIHISTPGGKMVCAAFAYDVLPCRLAHEASTS